eukprot:gene18349-14256_t
MGAFGDFIELFITLDDLRMNPATMPPIIRPFHAVSVIAFAIYVAVFAALFTDLRSSVTTEIKFGADLTYIRSVDLGTCQASYQSEAPYEMAGSLLVDDFVEFDGKLPIPARASAEQIYTMRPEFMTRTGCEKSTSFPAEEVEGWTCTPTSPVSCTTRADGWEYPHPICDAGPAGKTWLDGLGTEQLDHFYDQADTTFIRSASIYGTGEFKVFEDANPENVPLQSEQHLGFLAPAGATSVNFNDVASIRTNRFVAPLKDACTLYFRSATTESELAEFEAWNAVLYELDMNTFPQNHTTVDFGVKNEELLRPDGDDYYGVLGVDEDINMSSVEYFAHLFGNPEFLPSQRNDHQPTASATRRAILDEARAEAVLGYRAEFEEIAADLDAASNGIIGIAKLEQLCSGLPKMGPLNALPKHTHTYSSTEKAECQDAGLEESHSGRPNDASFSYVHGRRSSNTLCRGKPRDWMRESTSYEHVFQPVDQGGYPVSSVDWEDPSSMQNVGVCADMRNEELMSELNSGYPARFNHTHEKTNGHLVDKTKLSLQYPAMNFKIQCLRLGAGNACGVFEDIWAPSGQSAMRPGLLSVCLDFEGAKAMMYEEAYRKWASLYSTPTFLDIVTGAAGVCTRSIEKNSVAEAAGIALGWAQFAIAVLLFAVKRLSGPLGYATNASEKTKLSSVETEKAGAKKKEIVTKKKIVTNPIFDGDDDDATGEDHIAVDVGNGSKKQKKTKKKKQAAPTVN